jgi:hypothetical protein
MLTRTDTALDRPMILFQDIVEILHRSMSTVHLQNTGGFELNDGWRISSVLVGIDYPRREMVLPAQGFCQKALSRYCVAFSREKEVDRRTGGIDSSVQVYSFAFDPDVGLIDPPRVVGRFEPRAQTSFQFRGVTLHPSPDGDVVDQQAALGKEFLDFTVGQ